MEDLNLLSEELLEQIFVYLIDINWEEDQIDEILDQIWEIEKELELKDNLILLPNFPYINTYLDDYKYLVIYESPKYILLQDIPNQLYDYLEQIELFPFQGYSTTYQELEYNYIPYKVQNSETKNTESNRTRIPTTNQEPNPIQPNNPNPNQNPILNKYRELPKQRRKFPIIILNPNNLRTKGLQNTPNPKHKKPNNNIKNQPI